MENTLKFRMRKYSKQTANIYTPRVITFYHLKRLSDIRDTKCENSLRGGGYGPEYRTSDIPIWSHLMFGFA